MLLKNPNVFLFPLNWQPTKRGEKGKTFEKFSKIFTTPLTYTREFRTACTTQKQHNLQIVYYSCLYYICQFTMLLSKPNYKAPHLIATGNAVWQGTFSKIQSMFTISPHIKALGTAKPYPHFQNIPSASKTKKPLHNGTITDYSVCTCYVTAFASGFHHKSHILLYKTKHCGQYS